jgi:hypothetical protein
MKKIILVLGMMGFLLGVGFGSAQGQEKKLAFSLNLGIQRGIFTEYPDNPLFTVDARLYISIAKFVEISPEFMAVVEDWLYPGVMLNFKLGSFFAGVGAVLPIYYGKFGHGSNSASPKANIGYTGGHLTLTVYALTLNHESVGLWEYNYMGATVGYRF